MRFPNKFKLILQCLKGGLGVEKIYHESSSNFTFEFGGDDEIYAETLTSTINNIVSSLQLITTEEDPESYVKLKITSFSKGSFKIDLMAIINYIPTILTHDNIGSAKTIIDLLVSIIQIKKHLKGKKAKNVAYNSDEVIITNTDDEVLVKSKKTGVTYFNNEIIDAHIVNIFNIVKEDDGRSNIRIKQDNIEKVKIEKAEFGMMAVRTVEKEEQKCAKTITQTINAELLLRKPDLLGNSQWGFVFNKYISATVKDDQWMKKVHTGQVRNLYAGVKIPVKMQIEFELDEMNNIIKDSDRYTVLEITGDIKEPEVDNQLRIDN